MADESRVKIFKALADPTRLELVRSLATCSTGQKSCSDLSARTSLSQPAMSHHFNKLVQAGIVAEAKAGTAKIYKLNTELLNKIGIDLTKV